MIYQTYTPNPDLESVVKCYWTLQVPFGESNQKQLILPDGCVDLCFSLGDDVKRYVSENEYIIQPRQMLLGQITEPFYIEPSGYVDTFAVRFYPYGFANFTNLSLNQLANKETPLEILFGNEAADNLSQQIIQAFSTDERIRIIESFLLERLKAETTINHIVKSTVALMYSSNGKMNVQEILKDKITKRRQLERNFAKQIGISPKQLSRVLRLQATLQMLQKPSKEKFTNIAYDNDYYDQAHFSKDFKEFTGCAPKEFLSDEKMKLSLVLYKKD